MIRILLNSGWVDTGRGKGSHKVFVDPETGRVTTIPHRREFGKGLLAAIRRQTGIEEIR